MNVAAPPPPAAWNPQLEANRNRDRMFMLLGGVTFVTIVIVIGVDVIVVEVKRENRHGTQLHKEPHHVDVERLVRDILRGVVDPVERQHLRTAPREAKMAGRA